MKYIITEEQFENTIKKLNKDNIDSGELGNIIEELVIHFMDGEICDVAVIKTRIDYTVVILTPKLFDYNYRHKIAEYIKGYLGDDMYIDVYLQYSQDCEKM